MAANSGNGEGGPPSRPKRTRMVRPYPVHTLEDALTVAVAIQELNAGLPFDRVLLAGSLGTTPASSGFTMKLNSSARYGLTQGGYNDDSITLTPQGEAVVSPRGGEERREALVGAAMHPEVFGRFYRTLDGKRLPEDAYAQNMLQRQFGIHPDLSGECLSIIKANGLHVGVLREVGDRLYVNLVEHSDEFRDTADTMPVGVSHPRAARIYIGHSSSNQAVEFVRSVLEQLGIPYGMAEGEAGEPRPVAAGVSDEMRSCSSAVLVFATDDSTGGEALQQSTEKLLYQLGAASALFGERVVIFKEVGLDPADHAAGVSTVEFERDRLEEAGLPLLRGLQSVGAIRITV